MMTVELSEHCPDRQTPLVRQYADLIADIKHDDIRRELCEFHYRAMAHPEVPVSTRLLAWNHTRHVADETKRAMNRCPGTALIQIPIEVAANHCTAPEMNGASRIASRPCSLD